MLGFISRIQERQNHSLQDVTSLYLTIACGGNSIEESSKLAKVTTKKF